MNEQDTPMDALDRRLAAYLRGRAEIAAALGPGPDHVAASIPAGPTRVASPIRGARTGLNGVPTLVWALLAIAVLVTMALAIAAGSDRDNRLVVLPPTSLDPSVPTPALTPPPTATPTPTPTGVASPLRGSWFLDFPASGIDDTYGGRANSRPGRKLTFANNLWFGPEEVIRVWTGAGGGCETDGTWQATGNRVTITLPTDLSDCELNIGPAAREIRVRLAGATTFTLDGASLTLRGADRSPAIVYQQPLDSAGNPIPRLWDLGELELDFSASGINPLVSSGGVVSAVTSSLAFDEVGGMRIVTAVDGEPCDEAAGTYEDPYGQLDITVRTTGRCGDGLVRQDEFEVVLRLGQAAWYGFADDGALQIRGENGNLLLVYRARPGLPTGGSSR